MGFKLALGLFMLLAGVYLLVSAIRGKGGVYQNDNIRKGHEKKYRLVVRVCCFVISPLLIASFAFAFLSYCATYDIFFTGYATGQLDEMINIFNILSDSTRWAGLAAIIVMIILTMRLSNKSMDNMPANESGYDPAFDFDDEPTENSLPDGEGDKTEDKAEDKTKDKKENKKEDK